MYNYINMALWGAQRKELIILSKTEYDVVVIGAGNGGLSAAATTAQKGLKTLLIEQHNLPGGFASSFIILPKDHN